MVEFCDREGAEPERPNIFIGFSKISYKMLEEHVIK